MKTANLLLLVATLMVAACSFDASKRPIQPAPAVTEAVYCCASCEVSGDTASCDACLRSEQASCTAPAERLVCVSNRVEEPEGTGSYRVSCF